MNEPHIDLSPTAPRFDVLPYTVERDYTLYALFVCLGVMATVGLGLGYGASWLYEKAPAFEWAWLLAMAAALAGLGWVLVGQTRLRHDKISGLIALIAGGLAMGGMYYGSFLRSTPVIEEDVRRWLPYQAFALVHPGRLVPFHARLNNALPESVRERLTRVLKELPRAEQLRLAGQIERALQKQIEAVRNQKRALDPKLVPPLPPEQVGPQLTAATAQALTDFTFLEFFEWKANQGVRMWLPRLKTIHMNYTWSYIFWGVAALLMLLIPWAAMHLRAEKPLCLQCHRWKAQRSLGRLVLPEEEAVRTFKEGNIVQLASSGVTSDGQPGGTVRVKAAYCDECKETADIEVILERITQDKDGNDAFEEIVKLTYPGVAIKVLDSLFAAAVPPFPDERPAATPASDA